MTLAEYVRTYRGLARQLNSPVLAGQWRQMGVEPDTAAEWANAGFMPGEAVALIAEGVTPNLVLGVEAAIGTGDELGALTLDLLYNTEDPGA